MTENKMVEWALDAGFAAAAVVDTAEIVFDPAFRPYCEENLCGKYGVNYSCPPDCGSPEFMKQKVLAHRKILVLQSIWEIADYSDAPAIGHGKKSHNAAGIRLMQRLRQAGCPGFLIGASGCSLCKVCAITQGKPCVYPELQYSCMSAYCIYVKKLSDLCGMKYDCGPGLISFYGAYVFD